MQNDERFECDTQCASDVPIVFAEERRLDYTRNISRLDYDRADTVADVCSESREP